MSKKFLSLLLVLCMLLPLVPTMALPVFAADGDSAPVVYKYASAANTNFARTIDSEAVCAEAFKGDDGVLSAAELAAYKVWLMHPDTFAITQNDANWKAGVFNASNAALSPFTRVAVFESLAADGTHKNTQWSLTESSYRAQVDKLISTYDAANNKWSGSSIWGGTNSMGNFTTQNIASGMGWCGLTIGTNAMQFTASVAGTYTLSSELFQEGYQANHQFSIVVKSGGKVKTLLSDTAISSMTAAKVEAVGSIDLNIGDTVSFVVKNAGNPCCIKPVVTLVKKAEVATYLYSDAFIDNSWTNSGIKYDANLSAGENIAKLTAPGVWAITQNNPMWKVGQYNMTDGSLEPFARVAFCEDTTWAVTEPTYQTMITNYVNSAGATQSVWAGYALMGQRRYDGITSSASDGNWQSIHVAMQFTAPQDGRYLPSITALEEKGRHYVALMVNNEKVWPADDSWYRIEQGTKSTAGINGAIAAIGTLELQAGDVVSLVATRSEWGGLYRNPLHITPAMTWLGDGVVAVSLASSNGGSISYHKAGDTVTLPDLPACLGWDANNDGQVDYLEGATYTVTDQNAVLTAIEPGKTVFKSGSTHPTWDGSKIIFHDNWSIGHIVKATGVYAPVAYHDSAFFKVNSNGPWDGTGLGLYHTQANRIVFSGSVADGAYTPTIRYTAPYTGTVSLSYDVLQARREVNAGDPADYIKQGYAIYVGGQKVWPTEGDWYMYTGETLYPSTQGEDYSRNGSENVLAVLKEENGGRFAVTVPVKEGDYIEFRTLQGNPMTYHSIQQPTVTYTSIVSDHWGDGTSTSFVSGFGGSLSLDTTADSATYGKAILPAGWKLVSRKTSGYSDAEKYMDTLVVDKGAAFTGTVTANTWFAESGYPFGNNSYPNGAGYPVVGWYGKDRNDWWLGSAEIVSTANYAAGYQYTATAEGYVDISIDRLIQNYASSGANVYAAVFVDGVMIWPNVGGSYTQKSDWFSLKANSVAGDRKTVGSSVQEEYAHKLGDTSGLSGVYVKAGDKIELLFQNGGGGSGTWADITITEYPFATEFVKAVVDGTSRQFVDVVYAGQDATAFYSQLDTYLGWDMDNDGKADLANGGTIKNMTETTVISSLRADAVSRFEENLPFVVENNKVTAYDDSKTKWQVTKGDLNVDFTKDTETALVMSNIRPMTQIDKDGHLVETATTASCDLWSGTTGGMYPDCKLVILEPQFKTANGITYTAPYTGTVDLDFSRLNTRWEINAGGGHYTVTVGETKYYAYYNSKLELTSDQVFYYVTSRPGSKLTLAEGKTYYVYDGTTMTATTATGDAVGEHPQAYMRSPASAYLAIMLNGKVIWPTSGTPYLAESDTVNPYNYTAKNADVLAKVRAYEAFPTSLRVEAGDKISFISMNANPLHDMVYMDPMVTYTQVYDKAEAHAIIDVSSNFSVNIYAGEKDVRASESGVVVTGQVDKILAKDMADKITYQPYQIINGQRIDFAPKTISLADMLALYAKQPAGVTEAEAKTADALYHYGYAAANYFDGDELPGVTEALLASIQPDTSQKVEASLEEGVDRLYKILGATLMLEDELKMVFLIQTADGSAMNKTGLQLLVADENGHQKALVGADAFTLPAEGGNGSQMLVSFTVPVSQYQEKQYVTILKDGVKTSETVGYGVLTYVARQYEGGEGEADNLLRAIANITSPAPTFEAGLVKASDTATFKYCGTWEPVGDTMISHWNESYVEVDFYGTSVTPVFSASSPIKYQIDGGAWTSVTANGEYTITAATAGEHTLRIKTTGRTNNVYFSGVQVENKYAIHRADSKAHYIHFIGDSISDSPVSFSRRVGDVLGWDYATTALSGIALETGYGYWSINNPNMYAEFGIKIGMEDAFFKYGIPLDSMTGETRERYLGYYTDPSLNVDYSKVAYRPDIVFIFLGTNDQLSAVTDAERFTETYLEFVANIKAAYGDTVEIWAMQALTSSTYPNNPESPRFDCIQAAADALEAKYGDTFNFINQETVTSWNVEITLPPYEDNYTHPTGNGYNTLTEKISALLDAYYNTEA